MNGNDKQIKEIENKINELFKFIILLQTSVDNLAKVISDIPKNENLLNLISKISEEVCTEIIVKLNTQELLKKRESNHNNF